MITDEDIEALEILGKRDDLTPWEQEFLESLDEKVRLGSRFWTEKQKDAFERIWKEKMGA